MLARLLRRVAGALVGVALLGAAPASAGPTVDADGDPGCYTTRSSLAPAYAGPSASRVYDWVDPVTQTSPRFAPGVPLPTGLVDGRYVPQGLAGWADWDGAGEDLLLVSAYHDADGDRDADGPSAVFAVVADGPRAGTAVGRMLVDTGHVGGAAVWGDWLYVGSEHEIRGYRLAAVREVLAGPKTDTVQPRDYSRRSSHDVAYLGTGDGHVWAGKFSETRTVLNGYVQTSSSTGTLDLRPAVQLNAPQKAQGVTVTADQAIFSTSYGRTARGNLWIYPRDRPADTDADAYCLRVPTMNEGVTVLNSRLHLLFESGAHTYNRGLLDPDNRITAIHSAALTDVTALPSSGPED